MEYFFLVYQPDCFMYLLNDGFFFSIYTCLSVANHGFMYYRTWTLCTNMRIAWNICSHAEKMSFSAMSTSYAVKNECLFLQCRFHFEVSSFDCNLMCFGVEGINFGVQLDVCWSWTWCKKFANNLFNFYRFCTLTDWHIDRLDVIHIQRYSDIYSSSDISISVHLYSI